jgi:hypothetical protein
MFLAHSGSTSSTILSFFLARMAGTMNMLAIPSVEGTRGTSADSNQTSRPPTRAETRWTSPCLV